MDSKHKKTLFIIVAAVIIIASGIAYAYFRATVTRTNQTITTSTGTLSLIFTDNNSVGFADVVHFGETRTTKFAIENNGTRNVRASVYWKQIINTFLPTSLVYTLKYGDEFTEEENYEVIVDKGNVPVSSTKKDITMLQNIEIPASTTYNYILDITLVDSPDVDQTADLNATFYSEFTIKEYNYSSQKTLASLGLTVQESTESNPIFGYASPYTSQSPECKYNGFPVNTVNGTEETCGDVLESILSTSFRYYDISYYNDLLSSLNATLEYVGEAEWDEVNETCTYNGETVYLLHPLIASPSVEVEAKGKGCSQIYSIVDNEQNVIATGSGIKRVGSGTFGIVEQPSGIYSTLDDYGISYYFRGNVTNNYVKFGKYPTDFKLYSQNDRNYPTLELCEAERGVGKCTVDTSLAGSDMYWRIIRINGDGSIRMIYDGTSAHLNGETSADRTALKRVTWVSQYQNDVKYTGYMYGGKTGEASTSKEEAQRNETPSHMKEMLEAWYESVFVGSSYEQYISDEIFCNDRSMNTVDGELAIGTVMDRVLLAGYGQNTTEFSSNAKLQKIEAPSILCNQKNDAFTVNDTVNGNGALTYPIGLITMDESRYAGVANAYNNYNSSESIYNYLSKNQKYWSFSPYVYGNNNRAYVVYFKDNNSLSGFTVISNTAAVAPVINLSAEAAQKLTSTVVEGKTIYSLQE